ncbi:MAG: phage major capsid protein [Candidatus Eisenbacteria sp.]|nr:phage major capsid protein [Candidatus Eisenbacteria bacterium]
MSELLLRKLEKWIAGKRPEATPELQRLIDEADGIMARGKEKGFTVEDDKRLDEICTQVENDRHILQPRLTQMDPGDGIPGGGWAFEVGAVRALTPAQRMVDHVKRSGLDGIEPGELSLGRMLRGSVLGDWKGAEAEKRAIGESTGALGGFLIPDSLSATIIDLARNKSRCITAGAQTLPMATAEVHLARVTGDASAFWRQEHGAITESDPAFERIILKAMALGILVRGSVELLEDSPAMAEMIETLIAEKLALSLDAAGLMGTGVGAPRGLFYTENVGEYSMGTNGAAPTSYDSFSQAMQTCMEANEEPNAIIMAPRTFGTLDRLKEATTGAPLGAPTSYAEIKKFTTNQVPTDQTQGTSSVASCAFVGDFRQLLFGMRTSLLLEATRTGGTNTFAKMEVLIRGYLRADVAVLRPAAFTIINGITE